VFSDETRTDRSLLFSLPDQFVRASIDIQLKLRIQQYSVRDPDCLSVLCYLSNTDRNSRNLLGPKDIRISARTVAMQPFSKPLPIVSEAIGMGPFLPIMHDKDVLFHDSFSFQRLNTFAYLPSPTEVREVASRSANRGAKLRTRPPPVCFPSLGLLVKYGTEITSAEGQCLLFLRKKLPTVPVPKVFGWCEDDDQVFIYMELMEGITLEKSWDTLPEDDRLALCQQLRGMIDSWRRLSCDLTPPYIGESILAITT